MRIPLTLEINEVAAQVAHAEYLDDYERVRANGGLLSTSGPMSYEQWLAGWCDGVLSDVLQTTNQFVVSEGAPAPLLRKISYQDAPSGIPPAIAAIELEIDGLVHTLSCSAQEVSRIVPGAGSYDPNVVQQASGAVLGFFARLDAWAQRFCDGLPADAADELVALCADVEKTLEPIERLVGIGEPS